MKHSKWSSHGPDRNADFWEKLHIEVHIIDTDFIQDRCVFFPYSIRSALSFYTYLIFVRFSIRKLYVLRIYFAIDFRYILMLEL
jgi:hypothetical protein